MASAGQNLKPKVPSIPQALFDSGLDTRRTVVGDAFVDRALANGSTEFSGLDQELVTGWCWEWATGRPGLAKRDLSLLNIGTLMALNRRNELGVHVRGARNNGLNEEEIREAILQATVYCGVPSGVEAMNFAEDVLHDMAKNGETERELGGSVMG